MNKAIVESIGTFFLVLTIGLAAVHGLAGDLAPIAIGAALMAMIYAGGHVSGAHYNPAVTIAIAVRGKGDSRDIVPYVIAQLVAACLAAVAVGFLAGESTIEAMKIEVGPAIVAEILFTFALVWVILNVATSEGTANNQYYGLAIAVIVTGGAYAAGPISGAAFNPAVTVALWLMGPTEQANIWVYFVAQVTGGLLAALAFRSFVRE